MIDRLSNWGTVGLALAIFLSLLTMAAAGQDGGATQKATPQPKKLTYAIAIHGGAGSNPKRFSDAANKRRRNSLEKALRIGTEILKSGGTSLEAVEQVVLFLEDDPQFNAGKGAVFNAASSHELDASIMDGKTLECGAVAGVWTVKNPISLARMVMTETPHVLLAGSGAEAFATKMNVPRVKTSYFDTQSTLEAWKRVRAKMGDNGKLGEPNQILEIATGSYLGTVGCVALDQTGNLAAATSTGGMTNKQFGRVGDSPIVGAGTFADNRSCAVSCTGIGEQFIRNAVAFNVSAQMRFRGSTLDQSVQNVLQNELKPGDGGIIAVGHDGSISMRFNTSGMSRAAADSSGRFEVLWGNPSDSNKLP
ncbi:MAG: isoaspartyl peptidase/L-asparaginase [Mariniblastus sp.]|nr:isoaspartyl peptidase/L-asparaginase [Mariniblastus sp.]